MTKLSVVTAFLNEADNLPLLRERVMSMLAGLACDYEIILVDDHSTDGSAAYSRNWATEDRRVRYFRLSRNCGSHSAFTAGLAAVEGDCAVLLAADLQDPPEIVPDLLAQWNAGYDVVWAQRTKRIAEVWHVKLLSRIYYAFMRRYAIPEMPSQGADFLLMDRKVVAAYNRVEEKNTSFLAMILWLGFRQTAIEYVKQARVHGRGKWTLRKKLTLFIDSVISFSCAPLRIASLLGLMTAMIGFIYAAVVLLNFAVGAPVTGWSSLMIVVLISAGIHMLMLGLLGEYLFRTFDQVRGRPRYFLEEVVDSIGREAVTEAPTKVPSPSAAFRRAEAIHAAPQG